MDIVYVVKPEPYNEELRHSLRSLVNLPHDRVWLAGYRPTWVSPKVGHVPVQHVPGDKFANSTRNLEAAAHHPEVSDDFIYFNDDFFVWSPTEGVPLMHRGTVLEVKRWLDTWYRGDNRYSIGMRKTLELLQRQLGVQDPLCYEVHAPMVMNKLRLLEALQVGFQTRPLHKRTLYGNMWHEPSEAVEVDDPKIPHGATPANWPELPFVSTAPSAWNGVSGQRIRRAFSEPCEYERYDAPR